MFYNLYCHSVKTNIPLDGLGLKQTQKQASIPIYLEFINHDPDGYDEYLNHQTQVDNDYGYYFIENIAFFEIFSGERIKINYFNKIDDDLLHSLLNYPFAILFNQRSKFVIHASSVVFKDKVFCFCGKTQSGKSSLASHLIKEGGSLISEDTCVFDFEDSIPKILPSYNFIKISDEVNEYKDFPFFNPILFQNKSSDRKGYILDSHKFYSKRANVDYFVYLEWSEEESDLSKLDNTSSLKMLLSNEFTSFSKNDASLRFRLATQLVNQCVHLSFKRKKQLETLDHFIKIFLKEI